MAEKIIYKNHCTPQEFMSTHDKWYLDGEVGRKLTGICQSKTNSYGALITGTYSSEIDLGSNVEFIYLKNTDTSGSNYLLINIGSMGAVIKLGPGESFASDVGETTSDDTTVVITASGTPAYEYIEGI